MEYKIGHAKTTSSEYGEKLRAMQSKHDAIRADKKSKKKALEAKKNQTGYGKVSVQGSKPMRMMLS